MTKKVPAKFKKKNHFFKKIVEHTYRQFEYTIWTNTQFDLLALEYKAK